MKMTYVLGFCFSSDRSEVLLIRKKHPTWQAGFLNGVGGKVEPLESSLTAMHREFMEEASIEVPSWDIFARLHGPDYEVDVYRCFSEEIYRAKDMTDEPLAIVPVDSFRTVHFVDSLGNLQYLIPLALATGGEVGIVDFYYDH